MGNEQGKTGRDTPKAAVPKNNQVPLLNAASAEGGEKTQRRLSPKEETVIKKFGGI